MIKTSFKFLGILTVVISIINPIFSKTASDLISAIQTGNQSDFEKALNNAISQKNMNTPGPNGRTPLMHLIESTNSGTWNNMQQSIVLTMLQEMLKTGAINLRTINQTDHKTVLMYAAKSLNDGIDPTTGAPVVLSVLQTLLTQQDQKGNLIIEPKLLNATDTSDKTALEYAANSANFQAPKMMMALLLTPGIIVPESLKLTTIQSATKDFFTNHNLTNLNAKSDWVQMGREISSIDLNAQDFTGTTVLMYVAAFTQANPSATDAINLVNLILKKPNLNLNLKNLAGKTAADFAPTLTAIATAQAAQKAAENDFFNQLNNGNFSNVTTANINDHDANGATPLMYAAGSNDPKAKLQQVMQIDGLNYKAQNFIGQTALIYAVLNQAAPTAVKILLKAKDQNGNLMVDINQQDDNGMTALMNALNINNYAAPDTTDSKLPPRSAMLPIVNLLLTAPNLNFALTDYSEPSGLTVLDYANQLATNGLDANDSANIVSALKNAINTVYLAEVLSAIQKADLTALNQTISLIVASGSTIDLTDINKLTPLMYAVKSTIGSMDTNTSPNTPVAEEIVQTLLTAGANVNAQDNNGLTPLMHAAKSNNNTINNVTNLSIAVEIIQMLLAKQASVTLQDKNNLSAYNYASSANNINRAAIQQAIVSAASLQLLTDIQNPAITLIAVTADLTAGADCLLQDSSGHAALYYAQQLPATNADQAAIVQLLTTASIASATTKLFLDLQNQNPAATLIVVNADLAAGANVKATDSNGHTALYYAQRLLDSNPDKNAIIKAITDANATTATAKLFSDIKNPQVTLITVSNDLKAGANPILEDSDNNTVLYYAQQLPASNGYKTQIIQIITNAIEVAATAQLFFDLQETPDVTIDTINTDLNEGADVTLEDKNNHNALYYAQQLPDANTDKTAIIQAISTAAVTIATNQLFNDLIHNPNVTLEIVNADLAAGANVLFEDSSNHTALFYANLLPKDNNARNAIINVLTTAMTTVATTQLFVDLQNPNVSLSTVSSDLALGANNRAVDQAGRTPIFYVQELPPSNPDQKNIFTLLITTATTQLFTDLKNALVTFATVSADVNAGANIMAQDTKGLRPIDYAKKLPNSNLDRTKIIAILSSFKSTAPTGSVDSTTQLFADLQDPEVTLDTINKNLAAKISPKLILKDKAGVTHTALSYAQQIPTTNKDQAKIIQALVLAATTHLFTDLTDPKVTLNTINNDLNSGANVKAVDGTNNQPPFYYAQQPVLKSNPDIAAILTAITTAATTQLFTDLKNPKVTVADITADVNAGAIINSLTKDSAGNTILAAAQNLLTLNNPEAQNIINLLQTLINKGPAVLHDDDNTANPNVPNVPTPASTHPSNNLLKARAQLTNDLNNPKITLVAINADIAALFKAKGKIIAADLIAANKLPDNNKDKAGIITALQQVEGQISSPTLLVNENQNQNQNKTNGMPLAAKRLTLLTEPNTMTSTEPAGPNLLG